MPIDSSACCLARSLALALAYRRLDAAFALDRVDLNADIAELIAAPILQRHALLLSIDEARKQAVRTLRHTYDIIQQDYLLGLDFDQPFTSLTDSVPAGVLMRCRLDPPHTRAWCELTRRDRQRLARAAQGCWASEYDPNTIIDYEQAWFWVNYVTNNYGGYGQTAWLAPVYYDDNYNTSDLEMLESL